MSKPSGEESELDPSGDPDLQADPFAPSHLGESQEEDDDHDFVVPRLPRGRGVRLFGGDLIRIAMFTTLLVAIVMLREPCSQGVARFVGGFEVDAGAPPSRVPEGRLIRLTGDETDEELKRKLGREDDAGVAPAPGAERLDPAPQPALRGAR